MVSWWNAIYINAQSDQDCGKSSLGQIVFRKTCNRTRPRYSLPNLADCRSKSGIGGSNPWLLTNGVYDESTTFSIDSARFFAACTDCLDCAEAKPVGDVLKAANVFLKKGEFDKAIVAFTEAIRLDPSKAYGYVGRASAYRADLKFDEAIADYDEAIRLDPKDAIAYRGRGYAYLLKRNGDQALADCNIALRLDPKADLAYVYRGMVFEYRRDLKKAIADYTTAIQFNPNLPEFFSTRAGAYEASGDFVKAIADRSEVIRQTPSKKRGYLAQRAHTFYATISTRLSPIATKCCNLIRRTAMHS